MKDQWWHVNAETDDNYKPLISTTLKCPQNNRFESAESITIDVQGVWVRDDKDGFLKGDNDLIIATKHRVGRKNPVDKVHFYRQEVPEKEWIATTFHPVVYSTNDFRPERNSEIAIQIRVYDEDGLSDEQSKEIQDTMAIAAKAASIAFPVFAPFAGLAVGAGGALVNLIDGIDDHDRIIDGRRRFAVNRPEKQGYHLLQPGFLVCFAEDVEADTLLLGPNVRLYGRGFGGNYELFEQVSYAVLRVDRAFNVAPDIILDEKMATLLSELHAGQGNKSTKALGFLRKTTEAYWKHQKLERLQELKKKEYLAEAEKKLLESLKSELGNDPVFKDFLST